ncbi:MAG: AAA family ATPase [Candidatus Micrarchaeia archaeon]
MSSLITRVELKNWKSHQNTCVDLQKGSNLFVGSMGSGKSSIVDAACFALYGTFPALKSKRVSLEDVVMKAALTAKQAGVRVVVEKNKESFEITRTVKLFKGKAATEASFSKNGKLQEGPQTQRVTDAVEKALKVDYELFTRTAYSEQNKIDYFLVLPKAERKRQMDQLLGIDRFETARSNATTLINRLKNAKAKAQSFLDGADLPGLEKERAELRGELAGLEKKTLCFQEELEKTKAGLEKVSLDVETMQKLEADYNAAANTLSSANAGEATISVELQRKAEFGEKNAEDESGVLAKLEEDFSKNKGGLEELRKKTSEQNAQVRVLQVQVLELERKNERLQDVERKKNGLVSKHAKPFGVLEKENAGEIEGVQNILNEKTAVEIELKTALDALKLESARCPVCDSGLSEHKRRGLKTQKQTALEKTIDELASLREKLRVLQKQKAALVSEGKELESLDEEVKELSQASEKLKELKARAVEENKKMVFAEGRVAKLQGLLDELTGRISKQKILVTSISEYSRLKKQFVQAKKQKEESQAKLNALGKTFNKPRLAQKRSEKEELQKSFVKIESEISSCTRGVSDKKALLDTAKQKIESAEDKKKELCLFNEKVERAINFQNALTETQGELRASLVDAVNEALGSVWGLLYPYADFKSLKLNASEDDYALELQTKENVWTSIENSSGGERSCASLALRISFAMVLAPNLSWLVLDEPTHNLDSNAVESLCSALREELPRMFEQIFIITHDESLKECANARVYRVDRDKETGGQSSVEPY